MIGGKSTIAVTDHALDRYRERIGDITREGLAQKVREARFASIYETRRIAETIPAHRLRALSPGNMFFQISSTGVCFVLVADEPGRFAVLSCWRVHFRPTHMPRKMWAKILKRDRRKLAATDES